MPRRLRSSTHSAGSQYTVQVGTVDRYEPYAADKETKKRDLEEAIATRPEWHRRISLAIVILLVDRAHISIAATLLAAKTETRYEGYGRYRYMAVKTKFNLESRINLRT